MFPTYMKPFGLKNSIKSHVKDWEFAFSPDSMEKLIDDGIDAQFLNPSNLQEQVRSIQQSLNSENNQVCSESFKNIRKKSKSLIIEKY